MHVHKKTKIKMNYSRFWFLLRKQHYMVYSKLRGSVRNYYSRTRIAICYILKTVLVATCSKLNLRSKFRAEVTTHLPPIKLRKLYKSICSILL